MLVSAHDGRIDHGVFVVGVLGQMLENSLPDSANGPAAELRIPFDATGKKWVRFAVWDSAGDGAWLQPTALKQP
jgi:hypothetical protein